MLESWVMDAERMHNGGVRGVVVTEQLFAHLVDEQGSATPTVGGLAVFTGSTELPPSSGLPALSELIEIAGEDRVCIYVGVEPQASPFPFGLDPAMPVVLVPIPRNTLGSHTELEMYNRLRWYGLTPDEAVAASLCGGI